MRVAVIHDGVVENTIEATPGFTIPGRILVPSDTANIGDIYSGEAFSPPPVVVPPPPRQITFLDFMDLFTGDEQLSLAGAAMTDPPTKLWYDRAVGAQFIDLDDPRLGAGLQVMVDSELISAARRDRVLAGLAPEG